VSVTALQNKLGPARRDSTDGSAPLPDSLLQPASHPPNLQLRLDFREIGFVPALFSEPAKIAPLAAAPQRSRLHIAVFRVFPTLHWNRVASASAWGLLYLPRSSENIPKTYKHHTAIYSAA
jgi:hypothetical protein